MIVNNYLTTGKRTYFHKPVRYEWCNYKELFSMRLSSTPDPREGLNMSGILDDNVTKLVH